jgi:predicted neutral ceramidase superfamily lipid hydrolase
LYIEYKNRDNENRKCTLHSFMNVISMIIILVLVRRSYTVHIIEKVKICFAILFFSLSFFFKSNELLCRSPSKELGPVKIVLKFLS